MISANVRAANHTYAPLDSPSPADEPLEEKASGEPFQTSSLHEQPWFHGLVRRVEAQCLLRRDGDFLIRESISQPGRFVLSGMWSSEPLHFEINEHFVDGEILYRFEEDSLPSIVGLVDFYRRHRKPVTKASGFLLGEPVSKCDETGKRSDLAADIELDATYAPCPPIGITPHSNGFGTEGKFSPLRQKVVTNQARRMAMGTRPEGGECEDHGHYEIAKQSDRVRTEDDYDQIDYEAMDELRRQPTAFSSPPTTTRATALSPPGRMYQKGKNAARMSTPSSISSVLPKMTRSASVANEEIGHYTPSHSEFPFNNLEAEEHEECKSDMGASHHLPTLNGKSILNLIGDLEESLGRNAVFKTSDRTQSCHNLTFNSLGRRKSSSSAHGDIAGVCRMPPILPERRPLYGSIGGSYVAPVAVKPTVPHAKRLGKDDDYSYLIPFAHSGRESSTPLRCPQWVYDLLDSEAANHDSATSSKCSPQRNQKLCSPPIAPKPTNLMAVASSHNRTSIPTHEQENRDVHNLLLTLSKVDNRTLALMMTEEDCRAFHLQLGCSEVLVDLFSGEKAGIRLMHDLIQRASLVHDSVKLVINEAAREGREKTLIRQLTELSSTLLHDLGNAFAFGNIVSAIKESTLGQKRARTTPLPQTLADLISAYEKICHDSIDGCRRNNHPVQLLPFIQPFFPVPSLFAAAERHQALPPPKLESSVNKRMDFLWSFISLAKQTLGGTEQWLFHQCNNGKGAVHTTILDNPFTNDRLTKLICNRRHQ